MTYHLNKAIKILIDEGCLGDSDVSCREWGEPEHWCNNCTFDAAISNLQRENTRLLDRNADLWKQNDLLSRKERRYER